MLLTSDNTIVEIAKEVAKLAPLEQQLLLTRLRVKRLKRKGVEKVTYNPKKIQKPTLKQIDKWKHKAKAKI
jgi:hypothetical protein